MTDGRQCGGPIQLRINVSRRRDGTLVIHAPSGRHVPGRQPTDERPDPLRFQTMTDLPARKGATLQLRGLLRVRWDGDVARTVVVVQIEGREIEVDLLPVIQRT